MQLQQSGASSTSAAPSSPLTTPAPPGPVTARVTATSDGSVKLSLALQDDVPATALVSVVEPSSRQVSHQLPVRLTFVLEPQQSDVRLFDFV